MTREEMCRDENKYKRFKCMDMSLGEFLLENDKSIATYLGDTWSRIALHHNYTSYEFYLVDEHPVTIAEVEWP